MIQLITHPTSLPDETGYWLQLLQAGADSILVRKPGWQESCYEDLLRQADPVCYRHLMIAGYPALCEKYGLQGVHFSEAARMQLSDKQIHYYQQQGWRLSSSIHTVQVLPPTCNHWNQLLLAPVFNSISKNGHLAAFDRTFRLSKNGYSGKVLALGGVDHTTAGAARHMQFDGIALLGALWQQPTAAVNNFCRIRDIWEAPYHQQENENT
jgi:thiamine-phosphate pyrophosphorylase